MGETSARATDARVQIERPQGWPGAHPSRPKRGLEQQPPIRQRAKLSGRGPAASRPRGLRARDRSWNRCGAIRGRPAHVRPDARARANSARAYRFRLPDLKSRRATPVRPFRGWIIIISGSVGRVCMVEPASSACATDKATLLSFVIRKLGTHACPQRFRSSWTRVI